MSKQIMVNASGSGGKREKVKGSGYRGSFVELVEAVGWPL